MIHKMLLLAVVVCLFVVLPPSHCEREIPIFSPPTVQDTANVYFVETFTDHEEFKSKWVYSETKKKQGDANIAKYDGVFYLSELSVPGTWPGDNYLVMKDQAKHYAISAPLDTHFTFQDDTFVVQYEVNFQQGLECGGAYLKLISQQDGLDLKEFHDQTGYTIMFGPDKCGVDSKVHFILRYKNPITGEYEEKHCDKKVSDTSFFSDKKTHALQLILHSNGDFDVSIDLVSQMNGNIKTDMRPPIQPPEEIADPKDQKPEEWDERETIQDPEAFKPEDWDEDAPKLIPDENAVKPAEWDEDAPSEIPDPDAVRPDDWDDDEDGDWEPPYISNPLCEEVGCGKWEPAMIHNPNYKGMWVAPMIDNPDYNGIWSPRQIPNPNYFEESEPYFKLTPIAAVGFELWTMNEGIAFDNIILTDSLQAGNYFLKDGWMIKYDIEKDARGERSLNSYMDYFVDLANDQPYLWAVYAAAIVLPIVLCCCLCPTKKRTPKPTPQQTDTPQKSSEPVATDSSELSELPPPVEGAEPSPKSSPTSKRDINTSDDRDSPDDEGATGSIPADPSDSPAVRKRTKKTKPRKDT
ncbi:Calnexin-like isoform X2 [Oopsacas minuta]|uniref:Calnexin-like isoform X2 n=1 Tax=Oopsacas minuta TaxID=111878 RepID=A0AAV7K279_9METZ|nr:Calnexin-like isoform X2 [Oopsacas minuta]